MGGQHYFSCMVLKRIILALIPALASAASVACVEINDPVREEMIFGIEETGHKSLPDMTTETLRTAGFNVSACFADRVGAVFSNIPAVYRGSGTYSLTTPQYYPSRASGRKYCFVAVSGNSPSMFVPDTDDIDGDGRTDYVLPDISLPQTDIVVASAMEGYSGGVVPLEFRHILARIGGVTARAASVSGHSCSAELKEVHLQVPSGGSYELFSSGICSWEVSFADSLMEGQPEDLVLYKAESSGIVAGPSYVSLGYSGSYSIPSDNVGGTAVGLSLSVVYDIYIDSVLREEARVETATVVLPGGMDTIFNLTLPMDSEMPLIAVPQCVRIMNWDESRVIGEII